MGIIHMKFISALLYYMNITIQYKQLNCEIYFCDIIVQKQPFSEADYKFTTLCKDLVVMEIGVEKNHEIILG